MADVKTTFIPKKKLAKRSKKPHSINPISFISWFIFFVTILATGGLYFYQFLLDRTVLSQIENIKSAREKIDPAFIETIKNIDKKLVATRELVNNHIAVSSIFKFLEDETVNAISYNAFKYNRTPDGKAVLELRGSARDYASIALQSKDFKDSNVLEVSRFSKFAVDEVGRVGFSYDALLSKEKLSYYNSVNLAKLPPPIDLDKNIFSNRPVGAGSGENEQRGFFDDLLQSIKSLGN